MKKYTENEILAEFMKEKPKKTVFGNYRIEENFLLYRSQTTESVGYEYTRGSLAENKKAISKLLKERDGKLLDREKKVLMIESVVSENQLSRLSIQFYETNYIAVKLKDIKTGLFYYFGNEETLDLIGRTVSYGNESRNSYETSIQKSMKRKGFHLLDFSDFEFSENFHVLEKGPEKEIFYKEGNIGNFYGNKKEIDVSMKYSPMLFCLENKTYLADIDERESKYKKLNYFTSPVSPDSTNIENAYESLKPNEVIKAENAGMKLKRMGSVFFIPCDAPKIPEISFHEKLAVLANSSYRSKQISDYITGMPKKEIERLSNSGLEKIPKSIQVEIGRDIILETAIEIENRIYALGSVSSANRANLSLESWHYVSSINPLNKKDICL